MQGQGDIILASSSPRRRELLAEAGISFRVAIPKVEEMRMEGEAPTAYVLRNAQEKARWVAQHPQAEDMVILGADTVVVLKDQLLEKPADDAEARRMLRQLSGREHQVITGVCLMRVGGDAPADLCYAETTRVFFKELTDEEIDRYVASGEPADKAGAYAIQGGAAEMVDHIEGSYTNVVGLPMEAVTEALKQLSQTPPIMT